MKLKLLIATILVAVAVACSENIGQELPAGLNEKLSNSLSERREFEGLDKEMKRYLRKWEMKGASVAIMRNDSLIFAKGYGWADEEKEVKMEAGHILRMASVSKLITAIGIMKLQDEGRLNIKNKVFGPEGVMKDSDLDTLIRHSAYEHLTIEHLLRHQGGFYRDPLFSSKDVMNQMRLDQPPTADDFFRLILPKRLRYRPGTTHRYSNFGYLLLSPVIITRTDERTKCATTHIEEKASSLKNTLEAVTLWKDPTVETISHSCQEPAHGAVLLPNLQG